MTPLAKATVALRIWWTAFTVLVGLSRQRLPELVIALSRAGGKDVGEEPGPVHLGRIVFRLLHPRGRGARCIVMALVHYRLLRRRGLPAELVIGLAPVPRTKDAHAWVELSGHDVGPPPGRSGHVELARYS